MPEKRKNTNVNEKLMKGKYNSDPSEMRKAPGYTDAVPGVNSPTIELPAYNPPVPNRAWTEMKKQLEGSGENSKKE